MSYLEALESHLHQTLGKAVGRPSPETDADGDYPVNVDGVNCWVTVLKLEDGPPLARAWSVAAIGVKHGKKVLGELNDANANWNQIRCVYEGGTVLIAGEIEIESLEPGELDRLVTKVASKTQHLGELITAVHGGTPVFAVDPMDLFDSDWEDHPPAPPTC